MLIISGCAACLAEGLQTKTKTKRNIYIYICSANQIIRKTAPVLGNIQVGVRILGPQASKAAHRINGNGVGMSLFASDV